MLRKSVGRVAAGLPLAAIACVVLPAAPAMAAPLNVSDILALSDEGASSPARTSSTSSAAPSVSADGMMVAFASNAADLDADHPSGTTQVYVLNRYQGKLRLVSRESGFDGSPGAGSSTQPTISADGRFVAFTSASNNLTDDDGTDNQDVFVRDLTNNATRLVSRNGGTAANGTSNQPAISPDGRYVAYASSANNLSDADGDGTKDVFLHDRSTGVSSLVSVGSGGVPALGDSQHPAVSAMGAVVAYESTAGNLATGDALLLSDVFATDTRTGTTELVSRGTGPDGSSPLAGSYAPSISGDGRIVAFESDANLTSGSNPLLRDVYVRDRQTDETTLVSRASGPSGAASDLASDQAAVSPDGGFVAFRSAGTNLSSVDKDPDTDIFVRDLSDGALALASRAKGGPAANGASSEPALGAAAGSVVFASKATNLVSSVPSGGTNVYATSMRSTLSASGGAPIANDGLTRLTTSVSCPSMCFIWATAKLTVTDGGGNETTRNSAGYGAQFLATTAPQNMTVYLTPSSTSWLKGRLAAGNTATVEIRLKALGMRGESATGYATGPLTLPAPAPAG